jgi:tetratricopeptide (TPR) repeat protein
LQHGKPQNAIAELTPAEEYEFADGFSTVNERAEALLRARQFDRAAEEYHKILDHRGVDPVSPLFPLAYLGLARAELQGGHSAESRAEYEKFFAAWREADPDLNPLQTARKEYAALPKAEQ